MDAKAYYSENDPKAAAWLRELIKEGLIAPGDVDERSITDVRGNDLDGYTQCHFFAGIGGWSLALRLAGWGDDEPVWTGSCPCQPFSAAGKRKGTADARHLWPEFLRLIAERRPRIIFGEQVASSDGRDWLGGKEGLRRLQDREAVERVLQELQGRIPENLQALLEDRRIRTKGKATEIAAGRIVQAIPTNAPGEIAGERREESGEVEGHGFQLGRGGRSPIASGYRQRSVSGDGHSVQPGEREDVGQPVDRQDQQLDGVREGERADCSVLSERDGERVGREQDSGDCERHQGGETREVGGPSNPSGIRIEKANRYPVLAGVRTDLEALAYAVGCADLCAAGVTAPHIRQRLFWMADADANGWGPGRRCGDRLETSERTQPSLHAQSECGPRGMADAELQRTRDRKPGIEGYPGQRGNRPAIDGPPHGMPIVHAVNDALRLEYAKGNGREQRRAESGGRGVASGCGASRLGHTVIAGLEGHAGDGDGRGEPGRIVAESGGSTSEASGAGGLADAECIGRRTGGADGRRGTNGERNGVNVGPTPSHPSVNGFWNAFDLIPCRDNKARRIEPGTFPLAHGVSGRVGLLRGYGNAIVPQVAAQFIGAYMDLTEAGAH